MQKTNYKTDKNKAGEYLNKKFHCKSTELFKFNNQHIESKEVKKKLLCNKFLTIFVIQNDIIQYLINSIEKCESL